MEVSALIGYKKVIAGLLMLLMIRTMSLNLNLSGIVLVCVQVIVGILTYFLMLLLLRDSMIQRFVTELLNRMKGYKK